MNCPTCALPLKLAERSGIEIDYCEKCRGVWLDRGELDKIIERAAPQESPSERGGFQRDEDDGYEARHETRGRRERENPIGELFDFF